MSDMTKFDKMRELQEILKNTKKRRSIIDNKIKHIENSIKELANSPD